MIIINLKGGLGNQLFQIFNGINLAIENDIEFKFNDSEILNSDPFTTKRNTYWQSFFLHLKDKVLKKEISFDLIIKEQNFTYSPITIDKTKKYNFITGFFQSYRYFKNNFNKIYKTIKLDEIIENKNYEYDFPHLCSIHFRFGDYKEKKEYHLNLHQNYYLEAIKKVISINGKKSFLVFYEKDDIRIINLIIHYLKKKYSKIRNFILIDTSLEDWEQLIIMSKCHSNIIANSSFSWWAAYLNKNPKKVVIRPSEWFGPRMKHNNIKDLCPPEWIKISV